MRWSFAPVLLVSLLVGDVALAQGPAMPDPRQMSGIPRVDPQTEPGTIWWHACCAGRFKTPASG
jgi:hypothetical protein